MRKLIELVDYIFMFSIVIFLTLLFVPLIYILMTTA